MRNDIIKQWQEFQLRKHAEGRMPVPEGSDIDSPEWVAYFRADAELNDRILGELGFAYPRLTTREMESQKEWFRANLLRPDAVDGFDDRWEIGMATARDRDAEWDAKGKLCHFCGSIAYPIHPDSVQQFGEPVCTKCFDTSFSKDPTNDV